MPNKTQVYIYSLFGIALFLFFYPSFVVRAFNINFLNVGNGDAIVITEDSKPIVIIDGGPDYSIDYFLSRYFPFLNCKIPIIFLTHPHSDHLVGLLKVIEHCKVEEVYENPIKYDSSLYSKWLNILHPSKNFMYVSGSSNFLANVHKFTKGSKISISGLNIISLYPPENAIDPTITTKKANDSSMVLLLDYGKFEALLLGDLEANNQQLIDMSIYNKYVDPPLEVLKLSHHGAEKALNFDFTSGILPLNAVISTGPNKYGHPSPIVVKFFKDKGINVLRTDEVGDISFTIPEK